LKMIDNLKRRRRAYQLWEQEKANLWIDDKWFIRNFMN
jgi:hypothetical protein